MEKKKEIIPELPEDIAMLSNDLKVFQMWSKTYVEDPTNDCFSVWLQLYIEMMRQYNKEYLEISSNEKLKAKWEYFDRIYKATVDVAKQNGKIQEIDENKEKEKS